MVIATSIIAVGTVVYVYYSHKQWKAISGQLEQMKQQFELAKQTAYFDQRPWVAVHKIVLDSEPVTKATCKIKITVHVRNSGKTPALALFTQADTYIADVPRVLRPLAESEPAIAHAERAIVQPNYDQDTEVYGIVTDQLLINAYNKGKLKLYVQEVIQYKDKSGQNHWTTVCRYHVHGRKPDDFNFCPRNEMDTEGESLPHP
jgi:hypothetical protein